MNQNRIWSFFQDERADVFSHANPRLRYLADQAKKLVQSQLPLALNIGVGNEFLENYLMKQGWRVLSLDPCEAPIKRLRGKGVEAEVGSIETLPYKDSTFDVVFCSEVLEHLSTEQLTLGFKEVSRVLKSGAIFLRLCRTRRILMIISSSVQRVDIYFTGGDISNSLTKKPFQA